MNVQKFSLNDDFRVLTMSWNMARKPQKSDTVNFDSLLPNLKHHDLVVICFQE